MLCKHTTGDVKELTPFALELLDGVKQGSSGWKPMTQEEIDQYIAESEAKAKAEPQAQPALTAQIPAEITGGKGEQEPPIDPNTPDGAKIDTTNPDGSKAADPKADGVNPPPATPKTPKAIEAKDLANGQPA